MSNAEDELRDLVFEVHRFAENRAEELLEYDPELVRVYYLSRQRSEMEIDLRNRLVVLTDFAETPFSQLAKWVRNYKNVGDRVKELTSVEELAADVADALEAAAEQIRLVASEVRDQTAELPVLGSEETMKKVQKANSQAYKETLQRYRSQILALDRKVQSQRSTSDINPNP